MRLRKKSSFPSIMSHLLQKRKCSHERGPSSSCQLLWASPRYQHPNTVFNLPPSPAPGKSAQSFPWHYAFHPPELMRWFKWKSFQRTSYFSSPSTYLAFGLTTWETHCKRRKHELTCLLDFCIDRRLVAAVKAIQPKTVPPVIYLSGTINYHFCLLGAELLIMTLNTEQEGFNLILLVTYKLGLKDTRFLLMPTTTLYTHRHLHLPSPSTLASFDLLVQLLNVYTLQGPWGWNMAVDSHILWELVSGQRVLCWISLKHRGSSRSSEVKSAFPWIRISSWKNSIAWQDHIRAALSRKAKQLTNAEKFMKKFFNIFIYFPYTFCLETQKGSCNVRVKAKEESEKQGGNFFSPLVMFCHRQPSQPFHSQSREVLAITQHFELNRKCLQISEAWAQDHFMPASHMPVLCWGLLYHT